MKPALVLLAATAMFAGACDARNGNEAAANTSAPITPVAPPQGGDWTKMVRQTPEGGFLMGNPNADVKVVEFASMTCPHCAEFSESGAPELINEYVKTGRVSFELRNYVRDGLDVAMSLIARCGGPERFFPLTDALFKSQKELFERVQSAPADQQQSLTQSPQGFAQLAGLQQWAAQRGLPSARSSACLADQNAANQLVQMTSDAGQQFNIPGTPSFVINGELAENASSWQALEPKIREALGERG